MRTVTELVHVETAGEVIDATPTHPFYVDGYGFKPAGELKAGDLLLLLDGTCCEVTHIEKEHLSKPVVVYNFEVEDWHTYYVTGKGVLVHNTCLEMPGGGGSGTKPEQLHHFATNKNKTYTPQFEEIANKYGLDLDDAWNKKYMPHQGRHPNEYHEYVLESMKQFDNIAQGDKNVFLKLYEKMKINITDNHDMLYKDYWRNGEH